MATKQQRCPKCNQPNELGSTQCAYCAAPLVQTCPRCGSTRPWYVARCSRCDARAADESSFTNLFREPPTHRLRDRYIVKETLATGRVSAVYRAIDSQEPENSYAIKEMSTVALFRADERRATERVFRAGLERWLAIQHPAIARVVETFSERDRHYVVLEYVPGWSLRKIIEDNRVRVTPDLARNWGAQLADLAAHLHTQTPPLHLPFLSPSHVMVTASGQVKVVDLGLTYLFNPNNYGPYGSTRGYAAPELESGPPTVATDIFGLGRLLYAILIGYMLEKTPPQQITLRQAVPGISPRLVKTIARAAHRDPEARFASMSELYYALWDEMEGILEPIEGWLQLPDRAARVSQPLLAARASPGENMTMADLGFQRDVRYGPEAPAPMPVPQSPPETHMLEEAKLSVYPRAIRIDDIKPNEVRRLVLTLRNTGNRDVTTSVVSHTAWLSAPKKAITLPPGKQARVLLAVRTEDVPAGHTTEPQAVSVESAAGRQWVGVEIDIATGPLLQVEQTTYDLGVMDSDTELTWQLVLTNPGRQLLTAHITSRAPWLRAPQGDLRCIAGGSISVPITLLPSRLPRGEQRIPSALVVDSDGGQAQIEVRAWRARAELDIGTNHMDLGSVVAGEFAERFLYIRNTGDGMLEGVVRSLLPWLQVHPSQFTCSPSEMVQITISVDSVGLGDGLLDIPQAVRIQTNARNETLSLRLQVRAARLVLGSSELSFGVVPAGEVREQRFVVRNDGSAPLECTVQSLAAWLTVSAVTIHCDPASATEIVVRADTGFFQQGQQIDLPAALRLTCGTVVTDVPASITVLRPSLRVEPEEVDFGYIDRSQPETRTLLIANDGTGRLAWNVQCDAVWAEIVPRSGFCDAGKSEPVRLTAYGLALESDSATATLIVNSDGGRSKIGMHVAIATPSLASDTALLDLGTSTNLANVSGSFRIFNYGLGLLRGSIQTDRTWLVVDRVSFECPTGRSAEVRVSTDMEEFPVGWEHDSGRIMLASNGGNAEIEVTLNVRLIPIVEAASPVVSLRRTEANTTEGRLILSNKGLAPGHVELHAGHPGLVLSRQVCDIKPGKSVRIGVEWHSSEPEPAEGLCVDILCSGQQLCVPVEVKTDSPEASAPSPQSEREPHR